MGKKIELHPVAKATVLATVVALMGTSIYSVVVDVRGSNRGHSAVVSARVPRQMHIHTPAKLELPIARPLIESSPLLERAREAALEGNSGEVRRLLEARVRSEHGSVDEARLVRMACKYDRDHACNEDIKAKYPES